MNDGFQEMKQRDKRRNLAEYLNDTMISQIRAYRINQGISQREVSRKSGVTQNIISRMESALVIPQFETLVRLAEALDLDVDVIISPKTGKQTAPATEGMGEVEMLTNTDKVKAHISLLKEEIEQLTEDAKRVSTDHGRGTIYAEIETAERILEREETYLTYMLRADELRQMAESSFENSTDIQHVELVDWLISQAQELRELKK